MSHLPYPPARGAMLLPSILLLASLGLSTLAFGQRKLVDERDQAEGWYLPVHGRVLVDGQAINDYELSVYLDNELLERLPGGKRKKGRFELELDIDRMYTVRITRPGYHPKMMYVDTSIPKDLVNYPDYECVVNLLPVDTKNIDLFYTDFPSAIVRYNPESNGFYHSEHYLTHIQTRIAAVATF